jgi:hypothetical protein
VRLQYLNMNVHPDRCNYSDIMDEYILCEHTQWREDLRDYIFSGEYEHLNDTRRIEQRIKDNEEYERLRSSRRIRRGSSLISELINSIDDPSSEVDMSSIYQQYVNQITLDYRDTISENNSDVQPTE